MWQRNSHFYCYNIKVYPQCLYIRVRDQHGGADMKSITEKQCSRCGETKPISNFRKDKRSTGGRGSHCDSCNREIARMYYYSHKEPYIARAREWGLSHPEKMKEIRKNNRIKHKGEQRAYAKEYRARNSEKIKARISSYQKKHREEYSTRTRMWRASNPEKVKEYKKKNREKNVVYGQNRRARLKKVGGKYTINQWLALCKKYKNKCLCCGLENVKLTPDHIIPIALGGTNNIENIQPLCLPCNMRKGTKTIDYRK